MSNREIIFNPDGLDRVKMSKTDINNIIKKAFDAYSDDITIKEGKASSAVSLFTLIITMIAKQFYENPLSYVDFGAFRLYKPDGLNKFIMVESKKCKCDLEEYEKELNGEKRLIEEFKDLLLDFINNICETSIEEESKATDIIKTLERNRKETKNGGKKIV